MAGVPSTSGNITKEQQTSLYYLRHAADRGATSAATAVAAAVLSSGPSQKPLVAALPSAEEVRLQQLRAEHPDYSAFMVDMLLYQEQQLAHARNVEERRSMELQKQRKLAARMAHVDELVSLPSLRDRDGREVPLDKGALAWMQQYRPDLASKWTKLVNLSHSALGSAPNTRRRILTDEEEEARVAEAEAEAARMTSEHAKRKQEALDVQVARLQWFRNEYEKRRAQATEARKKTEEEQLRMQQQSIVEDEDRATARRMALLEAKAVATRSNREARMARSSERRDRCGSRSPSSSSGSSRSEDAAIRRREALAHEASEHRRSASERKRLRHARAAQEAQAKLEQRKHKVLTAVEKSNGAVRTMLQDRQAVLAYYRDKRHERSHGVLTNLVTALEAHVSHGAELVELERRNIAAAAERRQHALNDLAQHAHSVDHGLRSVPYDHPAVQKELPSFARKIGSHRRASPTTGSPSSPRSRSAGSPSSSRGGRRDDGNSGDDDRGGDAENIGGDRTSIRLRRNFEQQEKKYEAGLRALDARAKEAMAATKRRSEILQEVTQATCRAHDKHAADVAARHEKLLCDEMQRRMKAIEAKDATPRVFMPPQPPKVSRAVVARRGSASDDAAASKDDQQRQRHHHHHHRHRHGVDKACRGEETAQTSERRDDDSPRRRAVAEGIPLSARLAREHHRNEVLQRASNCGNIARQRRREEAEQQRLRDQAAASAREDAARYCREVVHHHSTEAQEAAEVRRKRLAESKPKDFQHSRRQVDAAAERSAMHLASVTSAHWEKVAAAAEAASARRARREEEREHELHDMIRERTEKHRTMYYVQ